MTPKYLILAATIPRVPQHTLRTVRTRNSTLETSLTLVPPRPTGRRTQQELRHGGPSAGTYATRSAPAHPVRPPGLPTSLGASLPTAASAHGAQATTAGWRGASPACMCQSYGVLPVSTCQSFLLSSKQSTAQGFLCKLSFITHNHLRLSLHSSSLVRSTRR